MPSTRQREQKTYASEVKRTARRVSLARARHREAKRKLEQAEYHATTGDTRLQTEDLKQARKVERRLASMLAARVQDWEVAKQRFEAVNARHG